MEALDLWDLVVVGGGPAGAAAAITAARAGVRVLLLEKGVFPRHKVCGEFVSGEALDALAFFLSNHTAVRSLLDRVPRISGVRLFLDGRIVHVPVDPPAASIARYEMDAALWLAASSAGAVTLDGTAALSITGTGPFQIHTSTQTLRARAVIDTAGRWSTLSERPPEVAKSNHWIGLKAHYFELSPPATTDLYFFEGGYCGMQQVHLGKEREPHRIVVCSMVRAEVATRLEEVFLREPRLLARSQGWKALSAPVVTAPLLFRMPRPVRDSILRAGDAAGFVDPFVGDGMALALRGGTLAAEALVPFLKGTTDLAQALARYSREYEQSIAPVFRASSLLRRMLALPAGVRRPVLRVLEAFPSLPRLMLTKTRSRAA